MERATFVTLAVPGPGTLQALLLARSIRSFGGTMASEPIWALIPDGGKRMSLQTVAEFEDAGVRLVPFSPDPAVERIPFGVKAAAGAHAEAIADTDLLVWLDADTLVVGGAGEFLIGDTAALGYRPVHHRLIGLDADLPTTGIWKVVLDALGVPDDRLFRMYTSLGERIKAYFNAGVFVVRPERGLLKAWHDALRPLTRNPSLPPFFRENRQYETFLHQIVWTAVVLARLERSEMVELSPAVNYPLHLHDRIPSGRKAISLQRLVTVRTESLLLDPDWKEQVPILGPLAPWLETQPLMRSV